MADVQPENGYTRIAHEILEQMALTKLSPIQYRIIFVIWRYTYGFKRKEHSFSLSFFHKATNYDQRQLQRELAKLEERKIIFQQVKRGKPRIIGFNKDFDQWLDESTIGNSTNGKTTKGGIGKTTEGTYGKSTKGTIGKTTKEERNKENSKEISKEKDDGMDKPNPFVEYEKLFGFPSAVTIQNFNEWIDKGQFQEPEEILCEVIKRAALQNPKYPGSYIESAVKKLNVLGLFTLAAVQEYNAKFDQQIKQKNESPFRSNRPEGNSETRSLTPEEEAELKEMEEEFPF